MPGPFIKEEGLRKRKKRGDEKAYRAALQSLQSVDDLVEAVVNALQDAQKLENTVVIYTSDNGFIFANPGREGKNTRTKVR